MKIIPDEIKQKPLEYLILVLFFIIFAIFFILNSHNVYIQRKIIYLATATYFFWSLYHHYKRGDLQVSIIIEYLVFTLIAILFISYTLI
jgi:ABC-type multidrug transport system permease subunit